MRLAEEAGGEVSAPVVVVVGLVVVLPPWLVVPPSVGHVEKRVAVGSEVVMGMVRTTWDSIVVTSSAAEMKHSVKFNFGEVERTK